MDRGKLADTLPMNILHLAGHRLCTLQGSAGFFVVDCPQFSNQCRLPSIWRYRPGPRCIAFSTDRLRQVALPVHT